MQVRKSLIGWDDFTGATEIFKQEKKHKDKVQITQGYHNKVTNLNSI